MARRAGGGEKSLRGKIGKRIGSNYYGGEVREGIEVEAGGDG